MGIAIIMIASGLVGYWAAPGESGESANDESYYQVSTYARLSAGGYEGMISIERLLEHGDFGIGTVEGIDGEMMIIDGIAYRAGTDLTPVEVPAGTMIPFAMLTKFDIQGTYRAVNIDSYTELREQFYEMTTFNYTVYAIMIETEFESITIRSVPGQQEPYPPLTDVIADQTTKVLYHINGTLIGFVMPEGLGDINLAGFHLHFLSEDLLYGGHVLDMEFSVADISVDAMNIITVTYADHL